MCIYVWYRKDSHNKEVNTLYTVVAFTYYILPKCAKTREAKDKCCVSWCTLTSDSICDPITLDNLRITQHFCT